MQGGWKGYVHATWIAAALLIGLLAVGEPQPSADDRLVLITWTSAMLTTTVVVWLAPFAVIGALKSVREHRRAGDRLRLRRHAPTGGRATTDPAVHWATRGTAPLLRVAPEPRGDLALRSGRPTRGTTARAPARSAAPLRARP